MLLYQLCKRKTMANQLDMFLCLSIFILIQTLNEANTDVDTLLDIQDKYCYGVRRCPQKLIPTDTITSDDIYVNTSVAPPNYPAFGCCAACSCDTQTCDMLDTCCLDMLQYIPTVEESKSITRMTCGDPQFRPRKAEKMANAGLTIKMFQKCPSDYQNMAVILACEKRSKQTSFSTEIPVTDVTTSNTYQNKYCAQCHGISENDMMFWRVQVACIDGTFEPSSTDSIFDEILSTETCNLIYIAQGIESYVARRCEDVITECNVTGQWQNYDSNIEKACLAYSSEYDHKFKNVFCYMCNTNATEAEAGCPQIPGVRVDVSFVALLRIETDEGNSITPSESIDRCGRHQLHDHWKDVCRDLSCLFPKTLHNGTCVYMVDVLGGVNYGIFLNMTANATTMIADHRQIVPNIGTALLSQLKLSEQSEKMTVYFYTTKDAFHPKKQTNRQYLENSFIVYIEVESPVLKPLDTLTIDRMVALDGIRLVVGDITPVEYNLDMKVLSFGNDTKTRVNDSKNKKKFVQFDLYETNPLFRPQHTTPQEIMVTQLFQCTLVTIHSSEFKLVDAPYGMHVLDLNAILDNEEVILETNNASSNYSFRMCATKYDSLVKSTSKNQYCSGMTVSIKGILSVVCTVLSMTFLTIIIVTYLVYKQLRSQPGINNVILCTSLFVAQGLFQFGSGQACNVSAFVCKLIGILIHFSWLFVLFWMNVCCIHMVKVFRQSLVNSAKTMSCKLTSFYLIYATVGGAVFVAINIIQSWFQNSENSLGYGGVLCYISDSHMVTYLFVIPVGALILLNMTLYIFVIMKIKQASNVHSDSRPMVERNYFKIYTKLSTLTGGTWVFGYIYLLWQIDVVEYIFIILNALQGVFLFFSFIFNKQNIKLWKESINSFRSSSSRGSGKDVNAPNSPTNEKI